MSILGIVVRTTPDQVAAVAAQLATFPELEIALNPGDGRMVIIAEDGEERSAAQLMAQIALLPRVLNTSLVYEYSGPDVRRAAVDAPEATRFQSWRTTLSEMAAGVQAHGSADAGTAPH
jgi:nitrate reductase NapAB chaperone NapD